MVRERNGKVLPDLTLSPSLLIVVTFSRLALERGSISILIATLMAQIYKAQSLRFFMLVGNHLRHATPLEHQIQIIN